MSSSGIKPDPSTFDTVDQTDNPDALVAFLEAADTLAPLREANRELLEQLRLETAERVLDIGCGAGAETAAMAQRLPEVGEAVGIDTSRTMIEEATRRYGRLKPRARFQVADAMELPFADETFDACRIETVLLHLPDPDRALRQATRVTRRGGRVAALEFDHGTLVIDHPDRSTTKIIIDSFADAAVQGWMGRQLPRRFAQADLVDISVRARVILAGYPMLRLLLERHIDKLCAAGELNQQQAESWWSSLAARAETGQLTAGENAFLVAATRP